MVLLVEAPPSKRWAELPPAGDLILAGVMVALVPLLGCRTLLVSGVGRGGAGMEVLARHLAPWGAQAAQV